MSSRATSGGSVKVVLAGIPRRRAELLCNALTQIEPNRFAFIVSEQLPSHIEDDQLHGAKVLMTVEEISAQHAMLDAARRLRTERFHWQSLHLCVRQPSALDLANEWAIYFHPLPPDVRALAKALIHARPVSQARRVDMVYSALTLLADDLSSLLRSVEPRAAVDPSRVRQAMTNVVDELLSSTGGETFAELRVELERLRSRPAFHEAELKSALPLIVDAEATVRESGDNEHLLTILHTLNNILRLAMHQPENAVGIANAALIKLRALRDRGLAVLPQKIQESLSGLCEGLDPLVLAVSDASHGEAKELDQLAELTSRLYVELMPLMAAQLVDKHQSAIERIILIEDDPDWRRLITGLLKGMLKPDRIEIEETGTIVGAQRLLSDLRPALVLVDLGLPREEGAELIIDAGLSLISQFTGSDNQGRRFQHRFVVLTAAENYAVAVRKALDFGVSPASYLQKNPQTWESDLRSQVRLALQATAEPLPAIEIFKRTGRIARIEGLEIKLDFPQWCLLATLAESRHGVWNEPERLARILCWNYSLSPESRSSETDRLDPEQRILLQLPHYASELRKRLAEAYAQARQRPLAGEILTFDEETGYRLNANARVLEHVDEHFRTGRAPSVLVVEDQPEWGQRIIQELSRRGFRVRWARWVEEAKAMVKSEIPDLVSLDLELPATEKSWSIGRAEDQNSIMFLRFLRRDYGPVPVAILTAIPWRDSVMLDILRQGVRIDDYLSKYWDQPIIRLANSLSRLWQESLNETQILEWDMVTPVHPLRINTALGLLVSVADYPVQPTGKGREILRILSATPNVFVSRTELLEAIYGDDDDDDGPDDPDKALNQHIKRLRQMIKESTGGTVPGDQVICGERGIYWLRGIVQ